ncbi:MAG TPA: YfhO family protein [Anaeromyxobacteraceae bacterium]|nr:YfhO family protein [Anaeromyxobacteraceae bacterium]
MTADARPAHGAPRACIAMAFVLALFFAPALCSSNQFLFRDNGRMHWPVKHYVADQLRSGHFPEWNPYLGLGVPMVAGAVDAVQHPFNLLLALFRFELGFKLWALLSYLLAATGGFAWARQLGRSWHASLAAGLVFALSGPLVASSDNLQYLSTLAALPWVFAAAHAWLRRGGRLRLAFLGLVSGLCASAGDPQAWGFAVAALPLYATLAVETTRAPLRSLLRGLGATGASLIGAAPFILPVLAWMPESSRADRLDAIELTHWNLPLPRLLELVLPHMYRDAPGTLSSPLYAAYSGGDTTGIPWVLSVYVGISVLVLSIVGMVKWRPARYLVLGAILSIWMALGQHAGFGQLLPHLPLLRGFRYWEKMAIWPSLLLAGAASFGFDEVLQRPGKRLGVFLIATAACLLLLTAAGHIFSGHFEAVLDPQARQPNLARAFADNLRDGLRESGLICLVLGLAALAIQRGMVHRHPALLLATVVIADPFAANLRGYLLADPVIVQSRAPLGEYLRSRSGLQRIVTPFSITQTRWPQLRDFEAGWLWASHMLNPSFNLEYRVGNFQTYSGMPPLRLRRLYARQLGERSLPAIGIFGVGFLSVPASPALARSANLAPPFTTVAKDSMLPAFLLAVPHRERAYVASELASVDWHGALEFVLAVDPSKTSASVVEAPLPAGYVPPAGKARIVGDAPERVQIETDCDRRGLLVLNDTYASGWTARVDGRPREILPTNYLVRGVWIDGGRHTVEFTYRTPMLRAGWVIFLLGAAAIALSATITARPRHGPR